MKYYLLGKPVTKKEYEAVAGPVDEYVSIMDRCRYCKTRTLDWYHVYTHPMGYELMRLCGQHNTREAVASFHGEPVYEVKPAPET